MSKGFPTTDDSGGRRYPARPVLGVGAIVVRAGKVLLVERGAEPLKGYWSLPGGALETGETLADGIRREVLEETGLRVDPVAIVEVFERIMLDGGGRAEYHYVLIDYLCLVTAGRLRAASDAARARWVARGSLSGLRLTEGSLPVIEKAFGIYENLQR